MQDTDEQERRRRRNELVQRFAQEVAQWSAHKLRMTCAQPEVVRAAEERERRAMSESVPPRDG